MAHPHWAEGVVFLAALLESLAVVGLLVPGVAMMFGAGALIGLGAMPFWPVCLWAISGAVAGDGLSFWIGWRFRSKLESFWPLRNHPELLRSGVAFFQRYGDLSILFGRFVGPVRAVVPLSAGMLAMPPRRFAIVDLLSAGLWAPAYLLPGMVFGASLDLAAKVTGRLALVLILLLALVWFGFWFSRSLYLYFQPKAHMLLDLWFDFNRHHPLMDRLTSPLLYPWQRDYLALMLLGALLGVAWTALIHWLPEGREVSLRFLHNPWSDAFFLAVEQLADWPTLLVITAILGFWLLLTRCYSELVHWLISLGFCVFIEGMTGPSPGMDEPTLRAGVGYGFLALLLATWIGLRWRLLVYSAVILLWLLLIFARLYVGTVALVSLAMTAMLVMIWLGIAGVGYRRHASRSGIRGLGWLASGVVIAALGLLFLDQAREIERPAPEAQILPEASWVEPGWQKLPRWRQALLGRIDQPLMLQWAAPLAEIGAQLKLRGWHPAQRVGMESALYWLVPRARVEEIPVLPHFNGGLAEAFIMLRGGRKDESLILRLWPSGHVLENQVPIWIGTVARLQVVSALWGLVRFTEEVESFDSEAVGTLLHDLEQDMNWCPLERQDKAGYVWLIRRCPGLSSSAFHRFEKFGVSFGLTQFIQQEFDRSDFIHGLEDLAQDPGLLQFIG